MTGKRNLFGGTLPDAGLDALTAQLRLVASRLSFQGRNMEDAQAVIAAIAAITRLRASQPANQGDVQRAVGREIANIPAGITALQVARGLSREQIDPLQSYRTTEDCLAYAGRVLAAALLAHPVGDATARMRAAQEGGDCEPAGMTRPGDVIHDC